MSLVEVIVADALGAQPERPLRRELHVGPAAFGRDDQVLFLFQRGERLGELAYDVAADKTTVLEKHGRYVASVAMSPDGRWAASGSRDRSVRLWSLESGRYLELKVQNPVEQVLFSQRGGELLVAAGRAIHSWYVPIGESALTWVAEHRIGEASAPPTPETRELQADNLVFVPHEHAKRPSRAAIEAALGRPVPRTEAYKRQLLVLLRSTRWRTIPLPDFTDPLEAIRGAVHYEGFYDYSPVLGSSGSVEWHVNFADPDLFVAYRSGLFALDEMLVAEHPVPCALKESLQASGTRNRTEERGQPTTVLIAGVERRCRVATDPNPSERRPRGLYGNVLAGRHGRHPAALDEPHPLTSDARLDPELAG